MTRVDQFESVFRAADKPPFEYARVEFRKILAVCDLEGEPAKQFLASVRRFLNVLGDGPQWSMLQKADYDGAHSLLEAVRERSPDLIVTYRCLQTEAWRYPYTLGKHLDVMTQVVTCPVIVLPHPEGGGALPHTLKNTDSIMVVTDHLTGDSRLVNHAARFVQPNGTLYLTHIEDDATFERYIRVISKIPEIDTATAREEIRRQLLKEPADFIESCRKVLAAQSGSIRLESVVAMGHHLAEYRKLIREHHVDLLVMNTKDEDQLAMHGLAHPLAIELREIPLLML